MTFSLSSETEPVKTMHDLINDSWIVTEDFPRPELYISNDANDITNRLDNSTVDTILISPGSGEQYKYRGNIQYYDRIYQIKLIIQTADSRQRLRDLWKMVRAIIFDNKHLFSGYQLIVMQRYAELLNTDLNIWRAEINLQLESHGIPADTLL